MAYTAGLNQDAFLADDLIYDATLRNLELIGEAATHIPDAVRTANPQIPWRLIVATRNRLVHGNASLVQRHPVIGASEERQGGSGTLPGYPAEAAANIWSRSASRSGVPISIQVPR
jgi:hypothetical protein